MRRSHPQTHSDDHSHHHVHTASPEAVGDSCCHGGVPVFDGVDPRYKLVLWIVIGLNGAMFLTEIIAGHMAGSQALQADALDFLADTVTYGLSLAVIGMSLRVRATAALLKGFSLTLMGAWVLGSTAYHVLILGLPRAEIMGVIGVLALVANLASVLSAAALQGRRCECPFGLALLAQRRDRQRHRDGGGRSGLADIERVARSLGRGHHGGPVPDLGRPDPATGLERVSRRGAAAPTCCREALKRKGRTSPGLPHFSTRKGFLSPSSWRARCPRRSAAGRPPHRPSAGS